MLEGGAGVHLSILRRYSGSLLDALLCAAQDFVLGRCSGPPVVSSGAAIPNMELIAHLRLYRLAADRAKDDKTRQVLLEYAAELAGMAAPVAVHY